MEKSGSTTDETQPKVSKIVPEEEYDTTGLNNMDSVDGKLFKTPWYGPSREVVYSTSKTDLNSEAYCMSHAKRGVAIIFNHINFKKKNRREGADADWTNLHDMFTEMGFNVRVYIDPSIKEISSILKGVAEENHLDSDCLIVVAMSHGESGFLHASNTVYPVDILWTPFTGNRCPSLAGKPKLFFIQACRGKQMDSGIEIMHGTDSTSTYSLPSYADIMVAYSTYDGYYSFRNLEKGSWFIQALCQELKQNWKTHDLLRMMTSVVRRVAIEYESFVPLNQKLSHKKQLPSIVSMLTRLVFFGENPFEVTQPKPEETETMKYVYYRREDKLISKASIPFTETQYDKIGDSRMKSNHSTSEIMET